MDFIKKLFPQAMQATDLKGLLIALLIYIVVEFVGGLALGLVGAIPLIGFVFDIIGLFLSIYCTVGILVSILVFFKIVK